MFILWVTPTFSQQNDGDGAVTISGELMSWHKITLTLSGPFAKETGETNPFLDYRMEVEFKHESGNPTYRVPGYFAADGSAADTSAESGTQWRAHLSPDREGRWSYQIRFAKGTDIAIADSIDPSQPLIAYDGLSGDFHVAATDKTGRDLRGQGRLTYVGERYLRFAESGRYFLKAGADAPETLLAFADFDNTVASNAKKAPIKTWKPHVRDWNDGDVTWKNGKGKGLVGAINYLSAKGCNAFSFLTYNAGGDGDNVWPFVSRNDKLHYDCSKLDQWARLFDHATHRGMYLHFKLQETENDDDTIQNRKRVPESLDGGDLGRERKLYCRELVARFSHELALNWNLGEENTQTPEQQKAMAKYIRDLDPYDHAIVVHTFPDQQDKVYGPLLGDASVLTGASLQNSRLRDTHWQTVKWIERSAATGRPWVVAFDESGSAAHGQCPDLGYQGFDGRDRTGKKVYTQHEVRKQTLWGTLMAGGAGVEYYFGYQFVENDLLCEDWRSRDQSWEYCRIAIQFFHDQAVPFHEMENQDSLVGNKNHKGDRFCLRKTGEVYLVYLANGGTHTIDLSETEGEHVVEWFNPRSGGERQNGSVLSLQGGGLRSMGAPPSDLKSDWLVLIRKK